MFHFAFEPTVVDRDLDALRPIGANVGEAPPKSETWSWMARVLTSSTPFGWRCPLASTVLTSGPWPFLSVGTWSTRVKTDGPSLVPTTCHSLLVLDDALLVGSAWGLWVVDGGREATYGAREQALLPGELAALATVEVDGVLRILVVLLGRFANQALMSPVSNDSDFDGMTDGWELIHGLDYHDHRDAVLDPDGDGLDKDLDGFADDRLWTNLDEYRYIAITDDGYGSTDPSNPDTDMDGAPDGAEVHASSVHHHLVVLLRFPDDLPLRQHRGCGGQPDLRRQRTDRRGHGPDQSDSDGDGMPAGWEIEHRRWVGTAFDGGNNWTRPMRADDALWDADRDGLANIASTNGASCATWRYRATWWTPTVNRLMRQRHGSKPIQTIQTPMATP